MNELDVVAAAASTRCRVASTPSTWPSEVRASRRRAAVSRQSSTQENMREYLAEQAQDEEKRKAKEAEDELSTGLAIRRSWTGIEIQKDRGGSREGRFTA